MSSNMERVAAMPDASLYVNRDGRRADDCVDSHGGGNLIKIPRSVATAKLFEDLLSLSTRGQCDTFHKVMRISVFSITVLVTHCRDRGER